MEIQNITTAIKVGEFILNTGASKARLRVQYENLPKQVLTDNAGRVYILWQCLQGRHQDYHVFLCFC